MATSPPSPVHAALGRDAGPVWLSLLVAAATASLCGPAAAAPPLGLADWAADDPSLRTVVKIEAGTYYLGEVVELVARQCGANVEIVRSGRCGDPPVFAVAPASPAHELLGATASLFSYRGGEWRWDRIGQGGHFRYRLTQTKGAGARAGAMQGEAQERFEAAVADLVRAAAATEAERVAADQATGPVAPADRQRWGLDLFGRLFKPEEQARLLRGEQRATVRAADLPGVGRRLLADQPPGAPTALPGAAHAEVGLTFHTMAVPGDLMPSLVIEAGQAGGYTYAGTGPGRAQLQKQYESEWLLPGDREVCPAEAQELGAGWDGGLPAAASGPTAARLARLAERLHLAILARLPSANLGGGGPAALLGGVSFSSSQSSTSSASVGQTVTSTLGRELEAMRSLWQPVSHKWSGPVLLLAEQGWFTQLAEISAVPWPIRARLRSAQSRDAGLMPFGEILRAAAELTSEQFLALGAELPLLGRLAGQRAALASVWLRGDARRQLLASGDASVWGPSIADAWRGIATAEQLHGPVHLRLWDEGSGAQVLRRFLAATATGQMILDIRYGRAGAPAQRDPN